MAQVTIVNNFGTTIGWLQREFVLLGRTLEGVTKVTYKDNVEVEATMGGGNMPVGYGIGNYKAEFSLELLWEEVQGILGSLPAGTRIHEIPPFDFPILTIRNGIVKKDVIRNVILTGFDVQTSQGDKNTKVPVACFCTHIEWNAQ